MSAFTCDPQEVQAVKDGLTRNPLNLGIGILHEPTGQIHLSPMDQLPNRNGHDDLVTRLQLPPDECKGFAIGIQKDGALVPVNLSHLNGPQGQPGSLQMPADTFAAILQALQVAGL
jgi:hypothetical protein